MLSPTKADPDQHKTAQTRLTAEQALSAISSVVCWAVRSVVLAAHVAAGFGIVKLFFPHYSREIRGIHIQRWSGKLIRILGLRIEVYGSAPSSSKPTLILANHISWLDVFVLNTISVARFVAKSEVASWPLVGQLCKGTGTLFIERHNKRDTTRMRMLIAEALQQGEHIALFPEGTSSDGTAIKPFRSSLLQPALDCQSQVQPVYLRYRDTHGHISTAAAYCDEVTFGSSLWRLISSKGITVELHFLPVIHTLPSDDRRNLSHQIEMRIRSIHTSINRP